MIVPAKKQQWPSVFIQVSASTSLISQVTAKALRVVLYLNLEIRSSDALQMHAIKDKKIIILIFTFFNSILNI